MNILKQCKYGQMIFSDKDVWQGKSFITYGEYSEEEVKLFQSIIKPNSMVLDIGANIGSFTVPLSKIAETVIAFEPERYSYYTLAGNIALNNIRNAWAFNMAIGDKIGTIQVPEMELDKEANFGGLELEKDYSKSKCYAVTLNTVDNFNLPKCDFVKIDVEGMELKVLKGAEQTIKKFNPILYVENDREENCKILMDYIKELDYKIYVHLPPFYNKDNFYKVEENVFPDLISVNLLCSKNSIGNFKTLGIIELSNTS